ncbi:MAG: hypothetical protein J7521_08165 [Caulobacter sp.]|nr:hypothetical protein [Caulobacter sp.]
MVLPPKLRWLAPALLVAALTCSTSSVAGSVPSPAPKAGVGLCAKTAPDGFVILEARVVVSSGDAARDRQAAEDLIGSSLPMPNARMWREWLYIEVGKANQPRFDCAKFEKR